MLVRFKLFVICVTGFVLLSGCSSKEPDIQVLCNWTKIGNYIIKWETNPPMDGALKVYVSDNPELFDKNSLACTADLKRGVTRFISNDNITRKYFLLSFNDKYFRTVSARWLTLDYVHNLRDLGGYFTADRKHMVRWGRVFRSGQLSDINELDSFRIANLKVKTIIDLRSAEDFRSGRCDSSLGGGYGFRSGSLYYGGYFTSGVSSTIRLMARNICRMGSPRFSRRCAVSTMRRLPSAHSITGWA